MKTIPGSRRHCYMARLGVSLLAAALIAAMVGCEATPTTEYTLTVVEDPTVGGLATDVTGASPYAAGTEVSIRAVAEEGYQFVNWTAPAGEFVDANAAETTFIMPAQDVTITASFFLGRLIRDWNDLHAIRDDLSGDYLLMNELHSGTAGYGERAGGSANDGKGWQPIGTDDERFAGSFIGQGYTISGLVIDRPDESYAGLIGVVCEGGLIEDVGVVYADVTGENWVGSLVGLNLGTVGNSHATGSVTGDNYVGGLAGYNSGTVSNSHATVSVTGDNDAGGLAGYNSGTVSNSHATGSVTGDNYAGGLAGYNSGTVSNSHATGSVTGTARVGGLVGWNGFGAVSNSHATGSVTGDYWLGGLVGQNDQECTVSNSYATGSVTGTARVGGLVGWNSGNVSDSYAIGNVTGVIWVGGLAGKIVSSGTVTDSYATGSVTRWALTHTEFGGFVGFNYQGKIANCYSTGSVHYATDPDPTDKGFAGDVDTGGDYEMTGNFWDTDTSGQTSTAGEATGKNTTEMKSIGVFDGVDWDIVGVANPDTRNSDYIWNIVDGETYPFLSWEPVS